MRRALETLVALLLAVPAARAAVMAAPGYAVRTITTPDTVEGGVVREGDAIPVAGDVFVPPGGAALVSDAGGNGAGRVVKVVPGMATALISGLDLVGGITLAADGSLRIVDAFLNPDFSTTGKVLEYQLDGTL